MIAALLLAAGMALPTAAIPGSSLRLGMTLAETDTLPRTRTLSRTVADRRLGPTRYFGSEADTELRFEAGTLRRATFKLDSISNHTRDYIEDQFRREGLTRECGQVDDATHDCQWTGRVNLHLVWEHHGLTVEATPGTPPAIATVPAAVAPAAAAATPPVTPAAASTPAPALPSEFMPVPPPRVPTAVAAKPTLPVPASTPVATPHAPMSVAPLLPDTLVLLGGHATGRNGIEVEATATVPLQYPAAARDAGAQGVISMIATVDTTGIVTDANVVRGLPELNPAALEYMRGLRFTPLRVGGLATRFRVQTYARFLIH